MSIWQSKRMYVFLIPEIRRIIAIFKQIFFFANISNNLQMFYLVYMSKHERTKLSLFP